MTFKNSWDLKPDRFLKLLAGQLIIILVIVLTLGVQGILFFLIQSLFAILLLETVNYVEHYGLTRKKLSSGKVEAVGSHHSWDSAHLFTNLGLFNLGMHSDHHSRPRIPFYDLSLSRSRHFLPFGYPAMMVLAWFPPLWFLIMNPRCRERT